MYISDSSAHILAGNYHILKPGEALEYKIDDNSTDDSLGFMDVSDLWFDGATSGDKLTVSYLKETTLNY